MTTTTALDALREARLRTHSILSTIEEELAGHLGIDDENEDQNVAYAMIAELRSHMDRLVAEQAPVPGITLEHPAHDHPAIAGWTHTYDDGTTIHRTVNLAGTDVDVWTRDPHPERTEKLIADIATRPTLALVGEEER